MTEELHTIAQGLVSCGSYDIHPADRAERIHRELTQAYPELAVRLSSGTLLVMTNNARRLLSR